MSLIICAYVEEGIVMASDSRATYSKEENNTNYIGVHTSDSTNKTFLCPNNVGISTCGDALIKNKPISGFIESFIREKVSQETDIDAMPKLIKEYFKELDNRLCSTFIIAGYKKIDGKYVKRIYSVKTNNDIVQEIDASSPGIAWDGEADVLRKLLFPVYEKDSEGNYKVISIPRYEFNLYTLQDAVDFTKYGIKTTIDTMRFQVIPETVGGPIDILVIKPESSQWLAKKELRG